MASVTGLPNLPPADEEIAGREQSETEPLLGQPGDVAQVQGVTVFKNLILGGFIPSSAQATLD